MYSKYQLILYLNMSGPIMACFIHLISHYWHYRIKVFLIILAALIACISNSHTLTTSPALTTHCPVSYLCITSISIKVPSSSHQPALLAASWLPRWTPPPLSTHPPLPPVRFWLLPCSTFQPQRRLSSWLGPSHSCFFHFQPLPTSAISFICWASTLFTSNITQQKYSWWTVRNNFVLIPKKETNMKIHVCPFGESRM